MRRAHLAICSFVALLILFSFSGCAGGGVSAIQNETFTGLRPTPVTAQLTLPTGAAVPQATALEVWTSASTGTPKANGQIDVTVYNDGPQYAEARDNQGRLVVGGYVGKGRPALSARSTAEMLAFFAVGGALQRGPKSATTLLNGLSSIAGFDNVVTAVENAIKAQGHVSANDPAVKTALNAFAQAARGTQQPLGPTVSGAAPGLEISDAVDNEVQITNTLFRRTYAWLERTGYRNADGDLIESKRQHFAGWITIPSRYGGSVDSATGLIRGQYEWEPSPMDPMGVPSDASDLQNESEIYYKLTAVGPGRAAGDFSDLTTDQSRKWEETVFWTAYLDFYVPVFANLVIPLDGIALDNLTNYLLGQSQVGNYVAGLRSSMPTVTSAAAQGDFGTAVRNFVSSSQTASTTTPLTAQMMQQWGRQYGPGLFDNEADLINRVGRAEESIGMIDLVSATAEFAPLSDIQEADLANAIDITSKGASVTIRPDDREIGLEDTTDIRAEIKNKVAGATYRYEWSVSPNGSFFLQDVDGDSTDESPGGVLVSTREKVFIGNLTTSEGTATITCKVTRIDSGNQVIGTATTRVEFKDGVDQNQGSFRVEGRILTPEEPGERWGTYTLAIAEIPIVPEADHYAIVIEEPNGTDIARANWSADNPPRKNFDAELWQRKPANKFWYVFDATNVAQIPNQEAAEASLAQQTMLFTNEYTGIKIKVTVFFE